MRVMAVVYEPCTYPVVGVRVTGFVVEIGGRWVLVGAYPDRPIPLPPGGQVGPPLAAYALALGIQPVLTLMEETVHVDLAPDRRHGPATPTPWQPARSGDGSVIDVAGPGSRPAAGDCGSKP